MRLGWLPCRYHTVYIHAMRWATESMTSLLYCVKELWNSLAKFVPWIQPAWETGQVFAVFHRTLIGTSQPAHATNIMNMSTRGTLTHVDSLLSQLFVSSDYKQHTITFANYKAHGDVTGDGCHIIHTVYICLLINNRHQSVNSSWVYSVSPRKKLKQGGAAHGVGMGGGGSFDLWTCCDHSLCNAQVFFSAI